MVTFSFIRVLTFETDETVHQEFVHTYLISMDTWLTILTKYNFNFVFEFEMFEFNVYSDTKCVIQKKRSIYLRYLKIKKEIIALKNN